MLSIPIAIADPNIGTNDASVAANTIAQLIQTAALIAVPLAIALSTSPSSIYGPRVHPRCATLSTVSALAASNPRPSAGWRSRSSPTW